MTKKFELNDKSFKKTHAIQESSNTASVIPLFFKDTVSNYIDEMPTIPPVVVYERMNRGSDFEVIGYERLFNTMSSMKKDHFSDLKVQ